MVANIGASYKNITLNDEKVLYGYDDRVVYVIIKS